MTNPTLDTYDTYAHIYDEEVVAFWDGFPEEFIKRFVEGLPGKRILNVGSGSGRDALLLREQGLEVICQDGSRSMVEMTRRLEFESYLADFSDIDFDDSSFDGIWAYTSLIHIAKDEAGHVIERLRKTLKPQGMFAIGVIQGETAEMVERETMPGAKRYFKKYTGDELKKMIEPLGFEFLYELPYQPHNSVYLNQLYRVTSD